jgi:hypothetical protein
MFKQTSTQSLFFISIFNICIVFLPQLVFGQLKPIPADDRDIERIIAKIRPFEELARQCNASECPKLDCGAAQDVHNRLRDARIYMRYLYYWNKRAADSQMAHFKSVGGEGILASERAARVQKILAYQEWIVGIGTSLLDIASVMGSLDEILNNPKLLENKSYPEIAEMLDTFYEGMKNAESLHNRLNEARNDRDFPKPVADMIPALKGLSSDEINDLKSTVSDLGSLMKAAQKHGRDWRKILKESKGARSIGQIVGRVLKVYAEAEIAERRKLVDSLLNDIIATDAAQSQSFKDLQRIQTRRNKAEDAYLALSKLLILGRESPGGMTSCLMKMQNRCSSFDLDYTSKWKAPDEIKVQDFNIITEMDERKSWGRALLTINAGMPNAEIWLRDVPQIQADPQPTLLISKATVKPGEDFTVRFTAQACSSRNSWIGVMARNIPHGKADVNSDNAMSGTRLLSQATDGALGFKAPDEPGEYDVRMNDPDSNREIASVSFVVRSEDSKAIEASDVIAQYIKEVTEAKKQMEELYEYYTSGNTLKAAMDRHRVVWAQRYVGSWSGSIYLLWINSSSALYGSTLGSLTESQRILEGRMPSPQELANLARGMESFRQDHRRMQQLMSEFVNSYAKSAFELDKGHAGLPNDPKPYDDQSGQVRSTIDEMIKRYPLFGPLGAPSLVVSNTSSQVRWDEEAPQFPVYNRLLQRYNALKPALGRQNITDSERESMLREIKELRFQAQQLHFNSETTPNTVEELKVRYKFFVEEMRREIARAEQLPPQ